MEIFLYLRGGVATLFKCFGGLLKQGIFSLLQHFGGFWTIFRAAPSPPCPGTVAGRGAHTAHARLRPARAAHAPRAKVADSRSAHAPAPRANGAARRCAVAAPPAGGAVRAAAPGPAQPKMAAGGAGAAAGPSWDVAVRPLLSASYSAFDMKELPQLLASVIER